MLSSWKTAFASSRAPDTRAADLLVTTKTEDLGLRWSLSFFTEPSPK